MIKGPRIMLIGPQGSGKSTQAQLLSQKLGIVLVGTGDLLRQLAQEDSPEGREIKAIIERGELVNNQIIADLLQAKLESKEAENGFIVDGYPRSLDQLNFLNPDYEKVFYIDLPDEEAEKRLLQRGRTDDTVEIIRERLSIYHQQTEPILDYYQEQGKLIRIDGRGNIEEVARAIQAKL